MLSNNEKKLDVNNLWLLPDEIVREILNYKIQCSDCKYFINNNYCSINCYLKSLLKQRNYKGNILSLFLKIFLSILIPHSFLFFAKKVNLIYEEYLIFKYGDQIYDSFYFKSVITLFEMFYIFDFIFLNLFFIPSYIVKSIKEFI